MVALDEYFHHKGTKTRSRCCTTSISPGFQNRPLLIDYCSLIFERSADAYGNTLIFTAPDTTGNWWGDAAVQASYGANEIIYCGYRFDPETQLYYVRNRTYNPVLGRWIQRDPIGILSDPNLYEYVKGVAATAADSLGLVGWRLHHDQLHGLADQIEDRLRSNAAMLGTGGRSDSLLNRAEYYSGKSLSGSQVIFFIEVGGLKLALSVVEAWYGELTFDALAKKLGKKLAEKIVERWYHWLKRGHKEVIVIQSPPVGKGRCQANMAVIYNTDTERFEAMVAGRVGPVDDAETNAGGPQFKCNCKTDKFQLYVTGGVERGRGQNFNYVKIYGVQIKGPHG